MAPVPTYRELPPDRLPAVLRGLVKCAWRAEVPAGATGPHRQRVLPDGCMDLLLTGERIVVAGPDTAAHVADQAPGSVTTGLRFYTGALPALLGVPAAALRDLRANLRDVRPGLPVLPAARGLDVVTGVVASLRRVLRFRAAAALLHAGVAPAEAAARAGYADQPHLSREVRALAGLSPGALSPVAPAGGGPGR